MSYFFAGDLITSTGIGYSAGDSGHETILRGPATGATDSVNILRLPANQGTNGQALVTDGSGVLSFSTISGGSPAGSDTQLQYNNGGSFGAITGFTYNDGTDNLLVNTALSSIVATGNSANALAIVSDGGTSSTLNILNKDGTDNAALTLTATDGGIDMDAAATKDINIAGGQVTLVSKDNAASAISLTSNVGTSETIVVTNTQGTADGALTLTATAGGIDMDAAATKDVNIAGGQVTLVSKDNATSAISLTTNVGSTETIVVTNTQGTAEGALTLTATAGGIDMDAAATKDINIAGGQVTLVSKDNAASAISLTANQGTSETIVVTNTQGTNAAAIGLTATAGGITLAPGTAITTSKSFITTPQTLTIANTSALNPHQLMATTNNAVYLNLTDSDGTDTATIEVAGSNTAGQNMHLFFDNAGSNSLRLDFGNNLLTSGSGLAQYLTFSNTGQSASLMYVGDKWRIINTGAAVS